MENKKMRNAANVLETLCRVGGKICLAVGIVCAVFAVLVPIFGEKIFAAGELTLDLDFVKFHLAEEMQVITPYVQLYAVVALVSAGIGCGVMSYALKVAQRILLPMKEGRPFEESVADNLKKLAIVTIGGGVFTGVLGIVNRVFLSKAYDLQNLLAAPQVEKIEYMFDMDLSFVYIGCVLLFLSYIFRYGQQLQQQSDETL